MDYKKRSLMFLIGGAALLFLVGCTAAATPTTAPPTLTPVAPTPVPTTAPTPVPTQLPSTPTPTGPKVGHWQGDSPSVSFDVTDTGRISNFKIVLSGFITASEDCTVEQKELEDAVNTDGSFTFTDTYPATKFDENVLALLKSIGGVDVTKSPSGDDVVETVRVTGQLHSDATSTGTYSVLKCGKVLKFEAVRGNWSAKRRGP